MMIICGRMLTCMRKGHHALDIQEIPKNAERGELPPVRTNTVLIWIGFDQEPARDSVYKGYQEISKIVALASGGIEQSMIMHGMQYAESSSWTIATRRCGQQSLGLKQPGLSSLQRKACMDCWWPIH